jgi:hypothetical protein
MDEKKRKFRLSRSQAAQRALDLATEFLSQPKLEWNWMAIAANPSLMQQSGQRKVPRCWCVTIQWSEPTGNSTIDGGPMVAVDFETGDAKFQ